MSELTAERLAAIRDMSNLGTAVSSETVLLLLDALEAQPVIVPHSWYHDGDVDRMEPGTGIKPRGRMCQRCRFREGVIKGISCTGNRTLWDSAWEAGRSKGSWEERERIVRRVVGP